MNTSSPEKPNKPIYLPNEWHRRVATVAKHKGVTNGEYVVSKISTSLAKDEATMGNHFLANQNRNSSKAT